VSRKAVDLMRTILDFDCAETASKISSVSDAQNLVDFIFYVSHSINQHHMLIHSQFVDNKLSFQWWNLRLASSASLLVLEIYARMPVVPQSLFLNKIYLRVDDEYYAQYQGKIALDWNDCSINVSKCVTFDNDTLVISQKPACQSAILGKALSHKTIIPLLGICVHEETWWVVHDTVKERTLRQWRHSSNPPISQMQGCVRLPASHLGCSNIA
jgi:hypothetical protein